MHRENLRFEERKSKIFIEKIKSFMEKIKIFIETIKIFIQKIIKKSIKKAPKSLSAGF